MQASSLFVTDLAGAATPRAAWGVERVGWRTGIVDRSPDEVEVALLGLVSGLGAGRRLLLWILGGVVRRDASARKPIASDSPSAITPRTTSSRQMRRLAIGEAISWTTCAIAPSGLRTATAQLDGERIITPSRTAWPPIAVLIACYSEEEARVFCAFQLRWKRSTRPPVSISFCLPV